MKWYYIMVRFDGPYVTGFLAAGDDPRHAVRTLKRALWVRLKSSKGTESSSNDFHPNKIRQYLRSLKRPWRRPGNPRHTTRGKWVRFDDERPVVNITELQLPVKAGYWLQDIITGTEICNTAVAREGTKAVRVKA